MTTITLTKDERGEVCGFSEKDNRAWAKFKRRMEGMEPGELMWVSTWFERSGPYHRRHMAMLRDVFDAQEVFSEGAFKEFRKWTEAGAGHGEFIHGRTGLVFVPKSIAYHQIDQADMEGLHRKVKEFLRSAYAGERLWPHLSAEQRWEMIETLLAVYDQ